MAFGMYGNTANILLRNWLTFLLRECIIDQERIDHKNQRGLDNVLDIICSFDARMKKEILQSYELHKNQGTLHVFRHIYRANGDFLKYDDDIKHYTLPKLFDTT